MHQALLQSKGHQFRRTSRSSLSHCRYRWWKYGWLRRPIPQSSESLQKPGCTRMCERANAGCNGMARRAPDSQLLGICAEFRLAGQDVRTERFLEFAISSLYGVGLVRLLQNAGRPE